MIRSLYTAASGMNAQQLLVDTISNNIANANTNSFKEDRVEFADLLYQIIKDPDAKVDSRARNILGIQIGLGVKTVATKKNFKAGSPQETGNPTDLMINGSGFFQVELPNGKIAYTRNGNFNISADGYLTTADGYKIEPEIIIPEDAEQITITSDGYVLVKVAGEEEPEEVGRIELAYFINPAGLKNLGGGYYEETVASGEPKVEYPGEELTGQLMQGYLEASNVNVIDQMVSLITAQRGYEMNSKSIQVTEDMLALIAQLKR